MRGVSNSHLFCRTFRIVPPTTSVRNHRFLTAPFHKGAFFDLLSSEAAEHSEEPLGLQASCPASHGIGDFIQPPQPILGREADPNGLADWVNRIDSGAATREEVYQGFLGSQEFTGIANQIDDIQNTAAHAFVERLYSFVLGRQGDPAGVEHWVDQLASGNMSLRDVAYGFIFSPEYVNSNTSNGDYVTMLYNTILGRQPDSAGHANWTAQLDNGASRVAVFDGFVQSPEFAGLADVYGYRAY